MASDLSSLEITYYRRIVSRILLSVAAAGLTLSPRGRYQKSSKNPIPPTPSVRCRHSTSQAIWNRVRHEYRAGN